MDDWRVEFGEGRERGLSADDLPLGLALTDRHGGVTRANARLRRWLGRLPDGPDGLAGALLAAGVSGPRAIIDAALEHPQDLVLTLGGRERPLRLSSRHLGGGDRLHLFHELRDVGDDRARLAEWQSLIAHDLRSPLAVIQGYAGLLATGQPGPLNVTQAEFLAGIDAKIVELTRLLDDFLDLSRLEAGALQLRREPTGLAELLAQVRDEHRRAAAARGIEIATEVSPAELTVLADPLRLMQVIGNLVGNAVKYNRDGGWVRLRAAADDDAVRIEVADGGPGMDAPELAAVFEPFARGQAGDKVSGSGLGLAVVRRLVAQHGGSITPASSPGAGTTFTVRLPRSADDGDPSAPTAPTTDGAVQ